MPVLGRAFAKPINWLFSILSWLQLYCWCSTVRRRDYLYTFNMQSNTSNTIVTKKELKITS